MDPRSERAVRVGAEIESLRARRERLQTELEAIHRLLALREAEFQRLMRPELFRLDQDKVATTPITTSAPTGETSTRSITEQVRAHFLRNKGVSFSPSDVMHCLNLLPQQDAAVRQALKRLSAPGGLLIKQAQGLYQLNEQHPEGRAGLQHDW